MKFFIIVFYLLIVFFIISVVYKISFKDYLIEKEKSKKLDSFNKLIDLIYKDFNSNPYYDKIKTYNSFITYKFENGYRLLYSIGYLTVFNRNGEDIFNFKPSKRQTREIEDLLQDFAFDAKIRPKSKSYSQAYNSQANNTKESNFQTNNTKEENYSPKYYKILEKINLREDHLRKLNSNSSEYESLKNELSNYKIALEKIKNKNG